MNMRYTDKPLESTIEEQFVAYARDVGAQALKFEVPGWRNWPDRIVILPHCESRVFWIEFKRPGEELRPGQAMRINKMRAMGLSVYVAYTMQDAKIALNQELLKCHTS